MPSGYVSLIEQRLVETEILVLEMLSAIQKSGVSMTNHHLSADQRRAWTDITQKQSKSEKIEEWKSLPLGDERQRQAWLWKKQQIISGCSQTSTSGQYDADTPVGPASLLGCSESTCSTEGVLSSARALPRSQTSLASLSAERQDWLAVDTLGSIDHVEQATFDMRPSQLDASTITPSTSVATTEETSPPKARNAAPDRWRKYF
jgi:hypothetical protein